MRGVVVALVFCGFQLFGSVFGRLCGEGKGFASGAFVSVLVRTVERFSTKRVSVSVLFFW